MLPFATECYKEIKNILTHKISTFYFPRFRVETNENSKTRKEKRRNSLTRSQTGSAEGAGGETAIQLISDV